MRSIIKGLLPTIFVLIWVTPSFAAGFGEIPNDVLGKILDYEARPSLPTLALISKKFAAGVAKTEVMRAHQSMLVKWPGYEEFEKGFVLVPAGKLPDGFLIKKFSASNHPFTRKEWQFFFAEPPQAVPENERKTWFEDCPTCPVTYVRLTDQKGAPDELYKLLLEINSRLAPLGCKYDLPDDAQLHYMRRADVSGENQDSYSLGINDFNAESFVIHRLNNNLVSPQPIENMALNAFGLRVSGNVWNLTKTPSDPEDPEQGHAMRGGSGESDIDRAKSEVVVRSFSQLTQWISFTLIRDCGVDRFSQETPEVKLPGEKQPEEAVVQSGGGEIVLDLRGIDFGLRPDFDSYQNLIPYEPMDPRIQITFFKKVTMLVVEVFENIQIFIVETFAIFLSIF